jgi:hypothetical protein
LDYRAGPTSEQYKDRHSLGQLHNDNHYRQNDISVSLLSEIAFSFWISLRFGKDPKVFPPFGFLIGPISWHIPAPYFTT